MKSKKLIAILLIPAMLLGSFLLFGASAGTNNKNTDNIIEQVDVSLLGDANVDNNVSVMDAAQVSKSLSKSKDLTSQGRANGDVDGIYGISIDDVTSIQMYVCKKIKKFNLDGGTNISMNLHYDDYYDYSDVYPGYVIAKIFNENITSYQVSGGRRTNQKDTSVITKVDNNTFRCSGCGTCVIDLVPRESIQKYKELGVHTSNLVRINLNVSAAPLTMVYVSGQSDAYGVTSDNQIDLGVECDSVMCEQGQVYSTQSFYMDERAKQATGVNGLVETNKDNFRDIIPDRLNSSAKSLSNKRLDYPLYALTSAGKGKTGPDSGFAYEYNKLTGDKVWIINTAVGSSTAHDWSVGSTDYEISKLVYCACIRVRDAEVNAGHFILKNKIVLWMQGDADNDTSYEQYYEEFTSIINQFKSNLYYDIFAIIASRSSEVDIVNRDYRDLSLNYPRIIQNYVSNSSNYSDVYTVSRANESWISQETTKEYFENKYPDGYLTYPLRVNTNLKSIPTTLEEVHYDTHFGQAGHNENGIDAADNTYKVLYNEHDVPTVSFINSEGLYVSDSCTVTRSVPFKLSLKYENPQEGKLCSIAFDESFLSYDEKTEEFVAKKFGTTEISIYYNGEVIETLDIISIVPSINEGVYLGSGRLQLNWDKIEGASSYRIYFKRADWPKYVYYKTVNENTFIDSNLVDNVQYQYTVRAYNKSETIASAYSQNGYIFNIE